MRGIHKTDYAIITETYTTQHGQEPSKMSKVLDVGNICVYNQNRPSLYTKPQLNEQNRLQRDNSNNY